MKSRLILLIITAIISSNLMAQSYGLGNADPSVFSAYRIPDVKLHAFDINSQFSFSSQKSISGNNDFNSDQYYYNTNLSLGPSFYFLNQTDDKIITLNGSTDGTYTNNYNKFRSPGYYAEDSNKRINYELSIYLSGDVKNYLCSSSDYYYSAKANARIQMSQLNESGNSNNVFQMNKYQNYDLYFGIGWGRLRNVTPVVFAIRMQERLKLLNVIDKDLDRVAVERLAEQFANSGYLFRIHDRESKYYWKEIEEVLSNNGISLKNVNQYGTSYLMETPGEIRFQRYEGFNAGINLQLTYANSFNSNNDVKIDESFFTMGNIYFNYSHQLGLNSQLSFNTSISGGPNITANPYIKQRYNISGAIGYDFELTDRLVTSARYRLDLTYQNLDGQNKDLVSELRFEGRYFLEDQVSLNATYTFGYSEVKFIYDNRNYHSTNAVNLGISYYFDRGIIQK
jgi:hypothetical protein